MNRLEIIERINEASLNGNIGSAIELLNLILADKKYEEYADLVLETISLFQLYGFTAYLTENDKKRLVRADLWKASSYRGEQLEYYNRGQLSILEEIKKYQKVMIAAPTSYGKTALMIDYIVQNKQHLNNVIFILPTNSLVEELYVKFLKYNKKYDLNYNVTNACIRLKNRNVLLLTPERFLIMCQLEKNMNELVDIVVMDEMYKIRSEESNTNLDVVNDRSLRFRRVAEIVGKMNKKVIYLSPYTFNDSDSMKLFMEKYSIKKINRTTEYVSKVVKESESVIVSKDSKYKKVVTLLQQLYGQKNLVYVSDYSMIKRILDAYSEEVGDMSERMIAFCNHLRENYSIEGHEWSVLSALKKGVGVYIAPIPRYIKKEIVRLYEEKSLLTIIATTAFTEGVNCSAKNIIVTSANTAGNIKLTQLDLLNTIGRAGRFGRETQGYVYCVDSKTLEAVNQALRLESCTLDNDNYRISENERNDYEIEMMDEEYLSEEERRKKDSLRLVTEQLGLTESDLKISLSVSQKWKVALYKYFKQLDNENVQKRKAVIVYLLDEKIDDKYIEFLEKVFQDLKRGFEYNGISSKEAFPIRSGGVPAFDRRGRLIWARLFRNYVLGDAKASIKRNVAYIQERFKEISEGKTFNHKRDAEDQFGEEKWILGYYDKNLEFDYQKAYNEYFKFISNVKQYKIPFYLSFYISIFKLFLKKNYEEVIDEDGQKGKILTQKFEDGELSEEYQQLTDYGIPMITLKKLKDNQISMNDLVESNGWQDILDSYEKMMLSEYMEDTSA